MVSWTNTKTGKIELCRNEIVYFWKDTLWLHQLRLNREFLNAEASVLKEVLIAENLNDSLKQAFCNKMEQLLQKLDTKQSEFIQLLKPDVGVEDFQKLSDNRSRYQPL